jgi:hypothetical protein
MWTSSRNVFLEAFAGAVVAAVAMALWSPGDVWVTGVGFHPAWIVVLALAAHYGSLGLFLSLGTCVAALTGLSLLLGHNVDGLETRASSPSDMFALAASLIVAWLAMLHERKTAQLKQRLLAAERGHQQANEALAAFQDHVAPLRKRYERIDLSVSLWRDLACRLESGDLQQAARAALDLGQIRSAASSGVVYFADGNALGVLARVGPDSPMHGSDIVFDRTARAAVERHRTVLALEVEGTSEEDSDVAAPILDEHTQTVLGVIALRGVSANRLSSADVHDLAVIALWLAPALMRARPHRRSMTTVEAAVP